jgi:aryl-alcohol dehydrogenase-like predicted oxidoreductase
VAQKPWIVPIPGTTQLHHLDENFGGAAVELSPAELAEICAALPAITPRGVRSPESALTDL